MNNDNKKSLLCGDQEIKVEEDSYNTSEEELALFAKDTISNNNKEIDVAESFIFLKNDYKRINTSKGDILEYRMKRLLFYMGYYPKVGVILKTDQGNYSDTITDLDVMGIYIHKDFRLTSLWTDCKSGSAKPLERISWINGVKNTVHIDEVIFVKNGVRTNTRNFARKHDIRILEIKMIEKLEKDYNINPDDWRGSWNPETQLNSLATLQKIGIPETESYKRISNFITCDYWVCDKYSKAKKTITAIRQLQEAEAFPLKETQNCAVRWAIFELVVLFTLSLFEICRELYFFDEKDKQNTIIDGLLSGEISLNMRTKIVEATYKTAYSIIKQYLPDFQGKIDIPNIGMNPPSYANAFCDLVKRITNEPLEYFDLLRIMDFIFMEYDLREQSINLDEMRKLFPDYDNKIVSIKTILHFLSNTAGLRKNLFSIFN